MDPVSINHSPIISNQQDINQDLKPSVPKNKSTSLFWNNVCQNHPNLHSAMTLKYLENRFFLTKALATITIAAPIALVALIASGCIYACSKEKAVKVSTKSQQQSFEAPQSYLVSEENNAVRNRKVNKPKSASVNAAAAASSFHGTTRAKPFSLTTEEMIEQLYRDKQPLRKETDFKEMKALGGAGTVGYKLQQAHPEAKLGVMIAANSGLPAGKIGHQPNAVDDHMLNCKTQEESVWANVVLTTCGFDPDKQQQFHRETIQGAWGMSNPSNESVSAKTIQGIDFKRTKNPQDYNNSYLVENCQLSALAGKRGEVFVDDSKTFNAVVCFADSVNANPAIGTKTGTMQRTCNIQASQDYAFFKACVKEKLRSSLDAMASLSVTIPLVAELSCGIYAGPDESYRDEMQVDFQIMLMEVLNEAVGPRGEPRGSYFEEVVIPKI